MNDRIMNVMDELIARTQALQEGKRRPEPARRPVLRLVHDDGGRHRMQRDTGMKPREVEMRDFARTIRTFREGDGEGGTTREQPKLALVYSRE